MTAGRTARGRMAALFLVALGLGVATARADAPDGKKAPVSAARQYPWAVEEGEESEDASALPDPLASVPVLSTILITSPEVLLKPEGVTRAPGTPSQGASGPGTTGPSTTGPGGETGGVGSTGGLPQAPEPTSLLLGALGTGLVMLTAVARRRRRKLAAE